MKTFSFRFLSFFALMAAFLSFSSFGSVPMSAEGREQGRDKTQEAATQKQQDKKQARLDQRRQELKARIADSDNQAQKDRLQARLDRTDKPKKAEGLGLAALICGAVGLGLAVLLLIVMWFPARLFWYFWPLAWLASLAGLVLGIIGTKLNDNKTKARIGLILGAVGLGLLLLMFLLFWIIVVALIL